MPPARRALPIAAACAALLGLAPARALAQGGSRPGPCFAGQSGSPACTVWTGKVRRVIDGDTLTVDLDKDGTKATVRVRMAGIQAMELTDYAAEHRAGECHAVQAADRLQQLSDLARGRVRLAALNPASSSRKRPLRLVAMRIAGRWQDAGRALVTEGLALWLPSRAEWEANRSYSTRSQQAAVDRLGLFAPDACGAAAAPNAPIELWVESDADGDDTVNLEGEWVRIANPDPVNPLPLGGWWVRDSGLRRYTFPPTVAVPPGGAIRVRVGTGTDTFEDLYWNLGDPVFDNWRDDDRYLGDGAYLFDPEGDLRAWMIYPCRWACTDPAQNALAMTAHAAKPEYLVVRNAGTAAIDLRPYRLTVRERAYSFESDATLQPGESVRVYTNRGSTADDTHGEKHWDLGFDVLPDAGGLAFLTTYDQIPIACAAWGVENC